MSKRSRRAGRQQQHTLVYAANMRTLGQVPTRNRRVDRAVRDEQAEGSNRAYSWAADVAEALVDAPAGAMARDRLRKIAHDVSTDAVPNRPRGAGTKGRRSSDRLSQKLAEWEKEGWIKRDLDNDAVLVLDRAELRVFVARVDAAEIERSALPKAERERRLLEIEISTDRDDGSDLRRQLAELDEVIEIHRERLRSLQAAMTEYAAGASHRGRGAWHPAMKQGDVV